MTPMPFPDLKSLSRMVAHSLRHFAIVLFVFLSACAREEPPAEIVMPPSITPYHIVARGETLSVIAAKYNMNRMALIRVNRLKPPYRIFIGQKLIIIPKDANLSPDAQKPAVKPVTSVADTGEVSVEELPKDEKDQTAATLPVMGGGIPGSPTAAGGAFGAEALGTGANLAAGAVGEAASISDQGGAMESSEGDGPPPMMGPSQQSVPISNSGSMQWPVQGQVIKSFGVDGKGQRNDGINIAVPSGTTVNAVDGGTVAHVGNQARGFGNLVLVKHPGGKISVYGHLQQAAVKVGDQVSAGQKIGTAGTSGGVSQPQLHFELRQGKTPLNPTEYLK
jgi:murein DD-endopeptidase MepM/ murein hydrolase activator NlpD